MTAKARAIADDLASALKSRLPSLAVTQSDDTDQLPLVRVGTGAAGAAGALIKVAPQEWKTSFTSEGNPGRSFGPHCIKIVLESNPSGAAGADINTMAQLLPILAECALRGTALEVYQSANGNSPGPEDIVAGNLKATFHPTAHGIIANQ